MITDAGEEPCARATPQASGQAIPTGITSRTAALIFEVGERLPGDGCYYSDVDMMIIDDSPDGYTKRNGSPYARRSFNDEAE